MSEQITPELDEMISKLGQVKISKSPSKKLAGKRKPLTERSKSKKVLKKQKRPSLKRTGKKVPSLKRTDKVIRKFKRKPECKKEKEEIEYLKEELRKCKDKKKSIPKPPTQPQVQMDIDNNNYSPLRSSKLRRQKEALKDIKPLKQIRSKLSEQKKKLKKLKPEGPLKQIRSKLSEKKKELKKVSKKFSKEREERIKKEYKELSEVGDLINALYKFMQKTNLNNKFDNFLALSEKDMLPLNVKQLKIFKNDIVRYKDQMNVELIKKELENYLQKIQRRQKIVVDLAQESNFPSYIAIIEDIKIQFKIIDGINKNYKLVLKLIKEKEEAEKRAEKEYREEVEAMRKMFNRQRRLPTLDSFEEALKHSPKKRQRTPSPLDDDEERRKRQEQFQKEYDDFLRQQQDFIRQQAEWARQNFERRERERKRKPRQEQRREPPRQEQRREQPRQEQRREPPVFRREPSVIINQVEEKENKLAIIIKEETVGKPISELRRIMLKYIFKGNKADFDKNIDNKKAMKKLYKKTFLKLHPDKHQAKLDAEAKKLKIKPEFESKRIKPLFEPFM